jgi:two-component system, chemotaxis family, chemotaxis protein CheY
MLVQTRVVLIVEDSPPLASNLEIACQDLPQVSVRVAASAEEALAFLDTVDREQPVVILTDLSMPRMDGFEFIERVRADARFHHTPILVLSGDSGPASLERAQRLGAIEFFRKPYSPARVKSRLEQILAGADSG